MKLLKGGGEMQYLLESVRRSRKESQETLAKLINVDVRTYQNKEKGVTQFKQNEMFIIAKHFNCKVDELFLPTNFENHEVL
jgi:DNA-binding XRE family transcriptional regulator